MKLLLLLAMLLVSAWFLTQRKSENFSLPLVDASSNIDPDKWYFVGTRVKSRTLTEATGSGLPCVEFPGTVYKEAEPVNATCRENTVDNYSFSQPQWGMSILRVFVRKSKPNADIPFLIRHIQSGLYLMVGASNNVVFGKLTDTELKDPKTILKGQWKIKDSTVTAGKFGTVTRQQLLPLSNTNQVMQPEACLSGNNFAVKVAAPKDDACSGSYSNGIANMFTGWWFQIATGGIYIGHWQSNFRVHPYNGTAAQDVQVVLFNAAEQQALFEWRYV
jgi:hypothetical protein